MGNVAEQEEKFFRQRALTEAGVSYSVGAALPVLVSLIVGVIAALAAGPAYADTAWYRFLAYLLPQVCFAVTALLFFRRSRVSVRGTYRGCKWYYFPIAVLMQFGLMFSLSELNNLFVEFLSSLGYQDASSPLPPLEGWYLLPALLIIALLPAIFEETLFRGILVGRMAASGWGTCATVLISGALFSLFHGRPEQTIYQFLCGCCFALIAVRSGSVLPTVLSHFLNNALILVLSAFGLDAFTGTPRLVLTVLSALCLAGTLIFLIFFDRKRGRKGGAPRAGVFFLAAAVGIVICAVQWVSMLLLGFVHV